MWVSTTKGSHILDRSETEIIDNEDKMRLFQEAKLRCSAKKLAHIMNFKVGNDLNFYCIELRNR